MLDDASIDTKQLVFHQHAEAESDSMSVVTQLKSPAGNLEVYKTTLQAYPHAEVTQVALTVEMQVRVRVPKVFVSRSDSQVQQAADDVL